MKKLFCIFIITFLFACSNEKKHEGVASMQRIDLSSITFDKALKLSSFTESVEAIPLETLPESLIGEINKIYYRNGRYYMLVTNGMTNARTLVFSDTGKFLFKLDRIGQGEGEYVDMKTFALMPNADIKVFAWGKTVTYDSIGNYLYESPMSHYAIDALTYPDGSYMVKDINGGKNYKALYTFTQKDKEIASLINLSPIEQKITTTFLSYITFSSYAGKHYFAHPHCDTIYSVDAHSATPAYYLDFGKYKVDYSNVKVEDRSVDIIKKLSQKEHAKLGDFQFYSDLLMLNLYFGRTSSLCFYSLKTGRFMNGVQIVDDMYFKNNAIKLTPKILPHVIIDGYMYSTISPSLLDELYTNSKNSMSAQEWNSFKQKHAALVDLCENISEEDNPILLKIKLKNIS